MSYTCLTALQRRQLNSPLKSPGSVQFEFLQFEFALVQVRSVRQTGLFGLLWFVLWVYGVFRSIPTSIAIVQEKGTTRNTS